MNIYILVVCIYFLLVVIVSLYTKKLASRSSADYLIAGRNLGVVVCAVVVAAEWLGGMSTIGVSEQAFKTGSFQPILYNLSTAVGMIIIGFTVARQYRERNLHTVSEMIQHLFGKKARNISAISFLLAYVVLAFVQLQTCASVIAPLFSIDWTFSVIISSVIITAYMYIGGMHALAITGIMHLVVMFVGLSIATLTGLIDVGGFSALTTKLHAVGVQNNPYNPFNVSIWYPINLLIGGVLGGMAGQASIQPIFAAKNPLTAKRAAILSGFIVAPFGIMVAILGLIGRTGDYFTITDTFNAKTVLSTLLTNPEFISPIFGGLALAGILAAILSTVGPVNFAIVTIATKDIYHGLINPNADDDRIVKVARQLVILVNFVTIPLAIATKGGILDLAYISYAIRAIGAIVIFLGIYATKIISPRGTVLAFIGATLAVLFGLYAKTAGWFHIEATFLSVAASIAFILVGKMIDKFISNRKK